MELEHDRMPLFCKMATHTSFERTRMDTDAMWHFSQLVYPTKKSHFKKFGSLVGSETLLGKSRVLGTGTAIVGVRVDGDATSRGE